MTGVDAQIIKDFMRTRKTPEGFVLKVGRVTWPSPHLPIMRWSIYRKWPANPGEEELNRIRLETLADQNFFMTCQTCGQRTNIGHMHDDHICQSCAERNQRCVS